MTLPQLAYALAGAIACIVAVIHGVLIQKRMVGPLLAMSGPPVPTIIARLIAPLLHYSSFGWFTAGIALAGAAMWLGPEARLAVATLAGLQFLFAAICNLRATRTWHPGWVLMTAALVLIGVGSAAGP